MKVHGLLTQVVPLINDDIARINSGGCGWFAHTLSTVLAAKGIKADIVLMHWSWYDTCDVEWMIKNENASDINDAYRKMFGDGRTHTSPCFGHIGVRVGNTIYDSEGIINKRAISDPIDPDVMMLALVGHNSSWNPTFMSSNSSDVIPAMTAFLTRAFNCKVTL